MNKNCKAMLCLPQKGLCRIGKKKKKQLQTKEGICITQKIGTKQIQN